MGWPQAGHPPRRRRRRRRPPLAAGPLHPTRPRQGESRGRRRRRRRRALARRAGRARLPQALPLPLPPASVSCWTKGARVRAGRPAAAAAPAAAGAAPAAAGRAARQPSGSRPAPGAWSSCCELGPTARRRRCRPRCAGPRARPARARRTLRSEGHPARASSEGAAWPAAAGLRPGHWQWPLRPLVDLEPPGHCPLPATAEAATTEPSDSAAWRLVGLGPLAGSAALTHWPPTPPPAAPAAAGGSPRACRAAAGGAPAPRPAGQGSCPSGCPGGPAARLHAHPALRAPRTPSQCSPSCGRPGRAGRPETLQAAAGRLPLLQPPLPPPPPLLRPRLRRARQRRRWERHCCSVRALPCRPRGSKEGPVRKAGLPAEAGARQGGAGRAGRGCWAQRRPRRLRPPLALLRGRAQAPHPGQQAPCSSSSSSSSSSRACTLATARSRAGPLRRQRQQAGPSMLAPHGSGPAWISLRHNRHPGPPCALLPCSQRQVLQCLVHGEGLPRKGGEAGRRRLASRPAASPAGHPAE